MYSFVRNEVRSRADDYLQQRHQGVSVGDALSSVAADSGTKPIGLSFNEAS